MNNKLKSRYFDLSTIAGQLGKKIIKPVDGESVDVTIDRLFAEELAELERLQQEAGAASKKILPMELGKFPARVLQAARSGSIDGFDLESINDIESARGWIQKRKTLAAHVAREVQRKQMVPILEKILPERVTVAKALRDQARDAEERFFAAFGIENGDPTAVSIATERVLDEQQRLLELFTEWKDDPRRNVVTQILNRLNPNSPL